MQQYTPGDFLSLVSDLVPIYVPQIHRYRWSESEHPRHDAGRPDGGQFKATGQSGHSSPVIWRKLRFFPRRKRRGLIEASVESD